MPNNGPENCRHHAQTVEVYVILPSILGKLRVSFGTVQVLAVYTNTTNGRIYIYLCLTKLKNLPVNIYYQVYTRRQHRTRYQMLVVVFTTRVSGIPWYAFSGVHTRFGIELVSAVPTLYYCCVPGTCIYLFVIYCVSRILFFFWFSTPLRFVERRGGALTLLVSRRNAKQLSLSSRNNLL